MSRAPAEGARLAGAFRRDLDSQQPALDRAVPDAVRAMRAEAQLHTELRRAGEHRSVPTLEALAQHLTQLAVQRARALAVGEAHAVGRIGAEEPGPIRLARRERRGLGQQPRLEAHQRAHSGTRGVIPRATDRGRVAIAPAHPDPGCKRRRLTRGGTAFRLRAQALPERCVVTAPAEEAEIIAPQSRGPVGGDQRRLDAEGARAAERIEELAPARRVLRPAGAQQHSRRHVLLERRFPARAAVAAAVQALAGEIERYRDGAALRVRMHPHARALERNVGPRAGGESQRIDDAVLELERPEVSVGDRGVPPAEIARQGGAGRQVRRPVDLAHRGMELIRVARIETSELDEHTVGDARPEARAVDALERAEEGRAGRALAHLAHPAPLELAGEQIGKAARRAGAKSEEWRAHGAPEGISLCRALGRDHGRDQATTTGPITTGRARSS